MNSWLVCVAFEEERHEITDSLAFRADLSIWLLGLRVFNQFVAVKLKPSMKGAEKQLEVVGWDIFEPLREDVFVFFSFLHIF